MSIIFADTSALAKRYVPEPGSTWVRTWIEPARGNIVLLSEITIVEFVSALARRQRERRLPISTFARLRDDFLLHAEREYLVISLRSHVIVDASHLVSHYPLRTLDALQLACAREAARMLDTTPLFVSADR